MTVMGIISLWLVHADSVPFPPLYGRDSVVLLPYPLTVVQGWVAHCRHITSPSSAYRRPFLAVSSLPYAW